MTHPVPDAACLHPGAINPVPLVDDPDVPAHGVPTLDGQRNGYSERVRVYRGICPDCGQDVVSVAVIAPANANPPQRGGVRTTPWIALGREY